MNGGSSNNEQQQRTAEQVRWACFVLLAMVLAACSNDTESNSATALIQEETGPDSTAGIVSDDRVSLRESTISWATYQYDLTEQYGIADGSYDGTSLSQQTFQTWILENRYLRVTLLPNFGGRIISIIYKPTGHEELYQNPVGVPYQIGTGIFYYDWLMVYGGIFPTFPEPEHGKTWLLPWDFQVVTASDQEVTVAMSTKDEIDNSAAPSQYNLGATGLEVTYFVTMRAGRAAVDVKIEIANPSEDSIEYEYWTNATLAPGSDPLAPRTTAGAEIIAPIEAIKIPRYWQGIAAQEKASRFIDVYDFVNLRYFKNWPDMGIAYAFPDMEGQNFWGVINHDNEEGLFRIADNTITPGLKMWTWGFPQSNVVDPNTSTDESRPYIELWAGVTREFWQRASLPANSHLEIKETYSPSVGMANVTHANETFLVNMAHDGSSSIDCQIFGMFPDQSVQLSMLLDDQAFYAETVNLDPKSGNDCSTKIPDWSSGSIIDLLIMGQNDELLFEGELALRADS